jgi:hypothetical protein
MVFGPGFVKAPAWSRVEPVPEAYFWLQEASLSGYQPRVNIRAIDSHVTFTGSARAAFDRRIRLPHALTARVPTANMAG